MESHFVDLRVLTSLILLDSRSIPVLFRGSFPWSRGEAHSRHPRRARALNLAEPSNKRPEATEARRLLPHLHGRAPVREQLLLPGSEGRIGRALPELFGPLLQLGEVFFTVEMFGPGFGVRVVALKTFLKGQTLNFTAELTHLVNPGQLRPQGLCQSLVSMQA